MSIKIHLRDTGSSKPKIGISKVTCGWGFNVTFGYWVVGVRDNHNCTQERALKNLERIKIFKDAGVPHPSIDYDENAYEWWVDTGHSDVGPFKRKLEAIEHIDRMARDLG